ncbi:MAG: dihydroxyacetone kinase subunit DhaL [Anaerolineae bacterium]
MLTTVGYDEFILMLSGATRAVRENYERLSALDTAIGDGDHGVTMRRAVGRVDDVVAKASGADLPGLLSDIGWALLGIDGGATGPLLGSWFMGMSAGTTQPPLDAAALAAMFEAGLASVQEQTKAKVGDKTMMDALIPATQALRAGADRGLSIDEVLRLAAEAAEQGAASTKDLAARFGRARNLGERTKGTQDPGATSMSVMFRGFYVGLTQPVATAAH